MAKIVESGEDPPWFTWIQGRQKSGYEKFILFIRDKKFLPCDCYFLRYTKGSLVPEHTDPVPGYRHYRFNLILWKPELGGELKCEHPIFVWWRINFFRSDKAHSVTKIKKGCRYLFSVGFGLKD